MVARAGLPDRPAYTFLGDSGAADAVTFGELAPARPRPGRPASRRGRKPGDRALLLYPPGLEFIEAFLACLAAGVVAVPA